LTVTPGPASQPRQTTAVPAAGRLIGLDALRAVAAALVFAHHLAPQVLGPGAGRGLDVGVMIFFALSGYVLYRPFLMRRPPIGSFVVRRIARLWPAYLVASVGVAALFEPRLLADPAGLATMASTPLGVIWTLKLELVFYALVPLVARMAIRGPSGSRLAILIGFAMVWLAIGAASRTPGGSIPVGFAMWAFAPGMVIAELSVSRPELLAAARRLGLIGASLVMLSIVTDGQYPDIAGGIGAALMLPWFVQWEPGRLAGPAALAGGISYSVYLWHLPLVEALGVWSIPATLGVALVAFHAIEQPAMRVGRRVGIGVDEQLRRLRWSGRRRVAPGMERPLLPAENRA
jgi:peptidoglycan/LPS O-acetylase OafA/YrhL